MNLEQVLGESGNAIAAIIITILALAFGHYFRWDMFWRGGLPLLGRYVYGVSSLLIGFSFWQAEASEFVPVIRLVILAITGGTAVFTFYKIDSLAHWVDTNQRKNGPRKNG